MDKIFHIRALNSPNGDFREVELDLPATDYQLLDAIEQLRLDVSANDKMKENAEEKM